MIRANRENREWENEAWDKQADKAGESREQAQEDPIQKRENGQTDITGKNGNHIELISIIGEIEGHENLSGNTKTTKYEHILPFFNDTATTEIYTLSLHDALPIWAAM